jgi:transcriptional regulator CtsR
VFVLNRDIADFRDFVIMETALPTRYMENIEEVEIKPIKGIKSGYIAYATCTAPGHIVRIKLKYKDGSKEFFENLLKRIKKKYGEPDEYRGDVFHILVAWKWSFVDKDGNLISMTLQHNTLDAEEKKGNAIKLTMTNLIEEDQRCHKLKALDHREKLRQGDWKVVDPGLTGWDLYMPQ